MDIRIEKTRRAVKEAFLELRGRKPLEKIKVKELCEAAQINKSTFYAHYQDIYALADALEEEVIQDILGSIEGVPVREFWLRPDWLTRRIFTAFQEHGRETSVLFSGREQSRMADRIEDGLREHICREAPDYREDVEKNIVLSFCVQGAYHAFLNNSRLADQERLVELLGEIAKAAQRGVERAAEGKKA